MDRPQGIFEQLCERSLLFIVGRRVPFHLGGVPVEKVWHKNLYDRSASPVASMSAP